MHGDFSLNPLAYRDRVSRVLYQQGRVQLDSDMNELTGTLLHATRALAFDAIGPHGGVDTSFQITFDNNKFQIAFGHYWVDGIQCVNQRPGDFWDVLAKAPVPPAPKTLLLHKQPYYFFPETPDPDESKPGLFYLDAFEHHISSAQDDSLRELALLGPDTTSRAVVVWQVRKLTTDDTRAWHELIDNLDGPPRIYDKPYIALNLLLRSGGRLRARATITEATDPCVISPDARYRGNDNRLFRVEVHRPGHLDAAGKPVDATFKFSRDNGAEVYPIRELEGKVVQLDSLGRDHRTAIRVNDWVEVVDDEVLLMQKALPLRQVIDVNRHTMTVTLDDTPDEKAGTRQELHPILRRWEGPPIAIRLREDAHPKANWIDLADGVQVQFSLAPGYRNTFRTGDYWTIPTRTATGDVIWPHDGPDNPLAVAPHGVDHHYAPLDEWKGGTGTPMTKFRRDFLPLTMVQPKP
ncbi:MAG: DUF6519 domain-containing protein [Thermoanaerobaculia bacterium]